MVPLMFGLCCYIKVLVVFFVYNGGFDVDICKSKFPFFYFLSHYLQRSL